MAGVSRGHADPGETLDVGEHGVAHPMRADAEFGCPRQVLDPASKTFEPLVVQVTAVCAMEHEGTTGVTCRRPGHKAFHQVRRNRDPALLFVFLYEPYRTCCGRQVVLL